MASLALPHVPHPIQTKAELIKFKRATQLDMHQAELTNWKPEGVRQTEAINNEIRHPKFYCIYNNGRL